MEGFRGQLVGDVGRDGLHVRATGALQLFLVWDLSSKCEDGDFVDIDAGFHLSCMIYCWLKEK